MKAFTITLALLACLAQPVAAQAVPGAATTGSKPLPQEIPLFPLPDVVLFPGVSRPLLIFEPRYREMVADALKGTRIIGMVLLRPGFEKDYEGRPPVYDIGCAGDDSGVRAAARRAIRHPAPRPDHVPCGERGWS